MKRYIKFLFWFIIGGCFLLLFWFSETARVGAMNGILICGKIVIASLFPYFAVVLLLIRVSPTNFPRPIEKITRKLFHCSGETFMVYLLALVGGYPVGAKLIVELVQSEKLEPRRAKRMLLYSVNAGPGFVISAVGVGLFSSRKIGWLLWGAVTLGDILLFLILREKSLPAKATPHYRIVRFRDVFTSSISDAAQSTLNICAYVIIFSTFCSILFRLLGEFSFITEVMPLFEVTGGVTMTHNLYKIVFLIAFGGFSVWCQVFTLFEPIGISVARFSVVRIIHGVLSVLILKILFMIFPTALPTLSNAVTFQPSTFYSSVSLCVALFGMVILFLVTASGKNNGGNLKKDMLQ